MRRALHEIQEAVKARLDANQAGLLPLKIQDMRFSHNDKPYAELIISPNETAFDTVDGGDMFRGYVLFNIYFKRESGANQAMIEGQKFIDLFPRDMEIDSAGNQVLPVTGNNLRFTRTGDIKSDPIEDGDRPDWKYTPVLIPYELRSQNK